MNQPETYASSRLKGSVGDLAVMGGEPAFSTPLHVGLPNIGDKVAIANAISSLLQARRLSNDGPFVQQFESELKRRLGGSECIAVTNATLGLMLAAKALEIEGEVIMPAFTFVATAHAFLWQGVKPVFCDINPRTHQIDPDQIEGLITPRTTGIVGVHLFGRACEIEAIEGIAKRHDLRLIFDAAHAVGCSYHERKIGDYGDASVFSFHATKIVNSFEGGAITTNDAGVATKLRLMRNFGFTEEDQVDALGINAKMSEPAAAMGLNTLASLDVVIEHNRRNFDAYGTELGQLAGLRVLPFDEEETNNYQYVVVEVGEDFGVSRDELISVLRAENVLARRYFYPGCHQMQPYASWPQPSKLPYTDEVARRVIVLPTGEAVDDEKIKSIASIFAAVGAEPAAVTAALDRTPSTF